MLAGQVTSPEEGHVIRLKALGKQLIVTLIVEIVLSTAVFKVKNELSVSTSLSLH